MTNSLKGNLPKIDYQVQNKLKESLSLDIKNLRDKLDQVVNDKASRAIKMLMERADSESKNFVKLLNEQRNRIIKRKKYNTEYDQLSLGFANQELIQLRLNRAYWDKRIAKIERDLKFEPDKIRKTFEVATTPRVEPAGAIILWPLDGGDIN